MFASNQHILISSISDSDSRRITNMNDDRIKINKFDVYHEDRNDLNNWLIQLKVYFIFNNVSQNHKTLFAFIFFKDRAKKWFKFVLKEYLDDDTNSEKIFAQFNNFKNEIKRVFDASHEEETAKRIIQHLRQKISAAEYVIKF